MLKMILFIHIVGAITIFGFMAGSLWAVYKKIEDQYSKLAKIVALNFALQLISGSALVWQHAGSRSILDFCSKISWYVIATILVEGLLFYKIQKKQGEKFPFLEILKPITLGLAAAVITIFNLI